MKKIVVVFSLLAFVFALSSCQSGGPKADAKALIKKQEAFVKLQKDAAEDGKIDDKEIEEIVASFQSVMKDSEEIMKKYEEDSVGAEELSKEMELLAEEMEAEYSELESKVAECEGYDKLQEKMFEALFSGMEE